MGRPSFYSIGFHTFCISVFLFLILPLFVVFPMSFSSSAILEFPPPDYSLRWYKEYLGSRAWISATVLSVNVATCTMVLSTILGTLASLGFARAKFRGKEIINALIISPMIVPVIIIAIALYFVFARIGLIGSPFGLILAHTLLALPLVIINVTASLKGFDERLEQAAMNLGANRLQTFLHVTLPLIAPGIGSGALFAFIASFDEVVIALFVTGSRAVTLPRQMWDGIRMEVNPTISAVATILVIVSVIILFSAAMLKRIYERRRM
jgi:putative spermidine/putrescine transport system permease protein